MYVLSNAFCMICKSEHTAASFKKMKKKKKKNVVIVKSSPLSIPSYKITAPLVILPCTGIRNGKLAQLIAVFVQKPFPPRFIVRAIACCSSKQPLSSFHIYIYFITLTHSPLLSLLSSLPPSLYIISIFPSFPFDSQYRHITLLPVSVKSL